MHIEVFKCMFLLQLCKRRSHKIKIVYPTLDYTEPLQLSLKQGRWGCRKRQDEWSNVRKTDRNHDAERLSSVSQPWMEAAVVPLLLIIAGGRNLLLRQ